MKKHKFKLEYLIIILIVVLLLIVYAYIKKVNGETLFGTSEGSATTQEDTTTTTTQVEATVQTIVNTLSASGQVSSALTEQLPLHSTYYFEEIYFEENEYIAEGENILKYTNGTYMTAPYNLVITSLSIPNEDEQCTSKHYLEVVSTDTLTITTSVSEDNLDIVYVGQEAQITISALENKVYTGYITNISQTGTYSSNGSTFSVEITFENDGEIKIGMTASGEIILEKAEDVVTVPVEAIETSGTTKYVVVVNEDGTTQNVTVETGVENDAYVEIKTGITEGQIVQMTESTSSANTMTNFGNFEDRQSMKQEFMQGGEMPTGGAPSGIMPGGM